ncbi:MAG TPA: germination protein YpeB [Bacillota bacterium]|nr:germination protein YpeB [Bacillota bacterium]HOL09967.1 germination protein YpeB [Bacillota bacterium]HPO97966.1 germination protein YpeB [Bacillota bacterium]
MKNKFVIPILFIAFMAVAGWGYTQHQARKQWEINAENQYQRAFEELTAHVNNMEVELSKSLVTASFPQTIKLLTNIWRESNASQENLGQLPLNSVDLSRTKMFLAQAGAFSLNTAQEKLINGSQLTEAEWKILKEFHNQSRLAARHLRNLQQRFYTERTRWLEVDRLGMIAATTANTATRVNNNKITKAFLMLEDGMKRVPDIEFEGSDLDFVPKPTGLTGPKITAQQAVERARNFIDPKFRNAEIRYERMINGGFPSYMILVTNRKTPYRDLRLSVSVKGGHVAWMLGNREVRKSKLNLNQAKKRALEFSYRNGYRSLQAVSIEEYQNTATITLVPVRNEVLYYPELIKIQVALDNGDILGFEAINYLTFYEPDSGAFPKKPIAKISRERLSKIVSPHLKVRRIQLAQVLDQMYNKVLCYEVDGTQGNDRFLIYYNANTGREEKIRRVDKYGNELL